jgi:hypothetical protein
MIDVRVAELAARQHNRFARRQLLALGISDNALRHRIATGRWVAVDDGVYAIAPALDSDMGRWTAALLTEHGSVLSHGSAGAARGYDDRPRPFETITRPGSGGLHRQGSVLVHRSTTLDGDTVMDRGLPMTSVPRTLLDVAPHVPPRMLARLTREALRLRLTTVAELVEALATRHRGRRGSRRLLLVVARYADLPVGRCRSGAEVRALELLRDAGRPAPDVNRRIAGEEADLSWRALRLIVEIDGAQYHLDAGEDQRKQAVWEAAGWEVRRIDAEAVFRRPHAFLALAPPPNVDETPSYPRLIDVRRGELG